MRIEKIFISILCCLVIFLPVLSLSITPSDLDKAFERSKEHMPDIQKSIDKSKANKDRNERMKEEAEKTHKIFKEQVEPQAQKWLERMKYDGNRLVITPEKKNGDNKEDDKPKTKKYLANDERIYIFISSSVPKSTLKKYALDIDRIGDLNIVMVMRGCIKGCAKLMPTVSFIQDIIAPSEKEQLQVEVLIDPNLFRLYGIKKVVPAIVYAKGVVVDSFESSEGMSENLKATPISYSVYGDVSLEYAIGKINEKAKSSSLEAILKEMSKTWWQNKQEKQTTKK